jgi:hypothetical protein
MKMQISLSGELPKRIADVITELGVTVTRHVPDREFTILRIENMGLKAAPKLKRLAAVHGGELLHGDRIVDGFDIRVILPGLGTVDWTASTPMMDTEVLWIKFKKLRTTSVPTFPKMSKALPKKRVATKNLWTRDAEPRPLLENWPEFVYHATSSESAASISKGVKAGELYFAFAPATALGYGSFRFGADVCLVQVNASALLPRHIELDENCGGDAFIYWGRIAKSAIQVFSTK